MAQDGLTTELRAEYAALQQPASACVECGDCVTRCPFGVEVTEQMAAAARLLG